MVIVDGTLAYVLDVQIVGSDQHNLENFNNKFNYYKNNPDIKQHIINRYGVTEVEYVALTIHYKSICRSSYSFMLKNQLLSKNDEV